MSLIDDAARAAEATEAARLRNELATLRVVLSELSGRVSALEVVELRRQRAVAALRAGVVVETGGELPPDVLAIVEAM